MDEQMQMSRRKLLRIGAAGTAVGAASLALPRSAFAERPESVVSSNTMQLSGTSFAAPVVAGAAAMILAAHPDWTPDQLKGALMASAQPTP